MSTLHDQLEGSIALIDKRSAAIVQAQPAPMSPIQQLQLQIVREGDINKLEKLMDLERRWRREQAEQAFVEAMAAFKAESIRVRKDKENRQYNSRYTSLGNLVDTVTPYLSKHMLSASWDIRQAEKIEVTCVITHAAGHSKSVTMAAPPDTSGQKNPIQQIKSTITYLKICTFESACGLASVEGNLDDDGNHSWQQQGREMDERYVANLLDLIEASASIDQLKANYKKAQDAAEKAQDHAAARAFGEAKNEAYKRLAKGAK